MKRYEGAGEEKGSWKRRGRKYAIHNPFLVTTVKVFMIVVLCEGYGLRLLTEVVMSECRYCHSCDNVSSTAQHTCAA